MTEKEAGYLLEGLMQILQGNGLSGSGVVASEKTSYPGYNDTSASVVKSSRRERSGASQTDIISRIEAIYAARDPRLVSPSLVASEIGHSRVVGSSVDQPLSVEELLQPAAIAATRVPQQIGGAGSEKQEKKLSSNDIAKYTAIGVGGVLAVGFVLFCVIAGIDAVKDRNAESAFADQREEGNSTTATKRNRSSFETYMLDNQEREQVGQQMSQRGKPTDYSKYGYGYKFEYLYHEPWSIDSVDNYSRNHYDYLEVDLNDKQRKKQKMENIGGQSLCKKSDESAEEKLSE